MEEKDELELKKSIEETRQKLTAYKKEGESKGMDQEFISNMMSLNSITTSIMVVIIIALATLYHFTDGFAFL